MCVDAAAFRASVETLTNLKLAQVGTAGLKTALDAVQTSAQALLSSGKDLVGPPLTDLLTAVQGLQTTIAGLGDQPTLGAQARRRPGVDRPDQDGGGERGHGARRLLPDAVAASGDPI